MKNYTLVKRLDELQVIGFKLTTVVLEANKTSEF